MHITGDWLKLEKRFFDMFICDDFYRKKIIYALLLVIVQTSRRISHIELKARFLA